MSLCISICVPVSVYLYKCIHICDVHIGVCNLSGKRKISVLVISGLEKPYDRIDIKGL